jgi:putative two-component system response regulator
MADSEILLETVRHSSRVASLCVLLGGKAGGVDVMLLYVCALLHDIGKQSVQESLLTKPGKLSPGEFEQVKRHAKLGCEQIRAMIAMLETASVTALQHHERYGDGNGYIGLKGDEIQPFARIVSLCDVLDALMSRRPFKEPWQLADALEYIRENAGTQFDPYWAEVLLGCKDELAEFYTEDLE